MISEASLKGKNKSSKLEIVMQIHVSAKHSFFP